MLKVGITGGIGSGKSTVCNIFQTLGIPIYNADAETKQLYLSNSELKNALIKHFSEDCYLPSGAINKDFLRNIVNSADGNKKINEIVHPFVFEHFNEWVNAHLNCPYVIKEAAILFESGANKTVDTVIGVVAPMELKINRVLKRDALDYESIQKIISRQISEDELVKKCQFIIRNNENESLLKQVLNIHRKLLHQAGHFSL